MTKRQEKLIENYIRTKVRKMLKEESAEELDPQPRTVYYDISDSIFPLKDLARQLNDPKLKAIALKFDSTLVQLGKYFDSKFNKKWD